jgi:uncharacterized coiled-coil DUF342 family protein
MAAETILTISKDQAEYFRLTSELKYELDHQSELTHYARELSKANAKADDLEAEANEAKAEANEAKAEANEAKAKIRNSVANMRENGLSDELIAKYLGIPAESLND